MKEIIERLLDDIDGSDVDIETVRFTYKGQRYEIDLSKSHRDALDEALNPWMGHSRTIGQGLGQGVNAGTLKPVGRPRPNRVGLKAWARVNGWPDLNNEGGRLPREITEAFDRAMGNKK